MALIDGATPDHAASSNILDHCGTNKRGYHELTSAISETIKFPVSSTGGTEGTRRGIQENPASSDHDQHGDVGHWTRPQSHGGGSLRIGRRSQTRCPGHVSRQGTRLRSAV